MALEISHIRFALDLKDQFGVKDLKEYISGSVYPDSRYATGIDRQLSHPKSYEFEYGDDDFKKGWYSHLALDLIQGNIFSEILGVPFSEIAADNDIWVDFSAAKVIQDMSDFEKIDVDSLEENVVVTRTPNREDPKELQKFYDLIVNMCHKKKKLSIDDYEKLWTDWNINHELWKKMQRKIIEFQYNEDVRKKIEGINDRILGELKTCKLEDLVRDYKTGA